MIDYGADEMWKDFFRHSQSVQPLLQIQVHPAGLQLARRCRILLRNIHDIFRYTCNYLATPNESKSGVTFQSTHFSENAAKKTLLSLCVTRSPVTDCQLDLVKK